MGKKMNDICTFVLTICITFILAFMGLFVYTPEFLNGTKQYLDRSFYIAHSNFFIYLIILFSIILIAIGFKRIAKYILDLERQNCENVKNVDDLKFKLSKSIEDKIVNNETENIVKILERFVINNPELISVQIYEYVEMNQNHIAKFTIKPTNLKFEREGQYVNDIQECYSIDNRKLKEYYKVKNNYLTNGNTEMYAKYMKKLSKRLNEKEQNDITDTVIFDYCCLILSYQYYFEENPFTVNDISEQYKNKINDTKRNGFLRGLIVNDFYKFTHEGRSSKNSRIYITKCLSIDNVPHIVVITLNPSVIGRTDYSDFINQIGDKFYKVLTKDSNMIYNEYVI